MLPIFDRLASFIRRYRYKQPFLVLGISIESGVVVMVLSPSPSPVMHQRALAKLTFENALGCFSDFLNFFPFVIKLLSKALGSGVVRGSLTLTYIRKARVLWGAGNRFPTYSVGALLTESFIRVFKVPGMLSSSVCAFLSRRREDA